MPGLGVGLLESLDVEQVADVAKLLNHLGRELVS